VWRRQDCGSSALVYEDGNRVRDRLGRTDRFRRGPFEYHVVAMLSLGRRALFPSEGTPMLKMLFTKNDYSWWWTHPGTPLVGDVWVGVGLGIGLAVIIIVAGAPVIQRWRDR